MSDVKIPESDETLKAREALFDRLEGEVGYPRLVMVAIADLIDAKIADAVEYAADRVEQRTAALRTALSQPNDEGEGKKKPTLDELLAGHDPSTNHGEMDW